MKPAVLSGSMALPMGRIDVAKVIKDQTHEYWLMGATEPNQVLSHWVEGEYLHVPRQYGLRLCRSLEIDFIDETSPGEAVAFPRTPVPRDYQVSVIDEVVDCTGRYYDFIFRARTGFGKTISALIVAARLGRATLIVVDQDNLKDQWVESLGTHFGIPPEEVGIIQGKKCDYIGKAVTIAMVHTISRKSLPEGVYSYFGTLIADEVHALGAPTFSSFMMQFHATVRFGVSATPKRRDGLQKVLEYNLGTVRVYVADEHKRSTVYVAESKTVYSWYANTSPKAGRYLTEISEDGARNLLLAELSIWLYQSGRDTLILGDRIEQLLHLKNLCYYMGVPDDDMGMYTGKEYLYGYDKQPVPPRKPNDWQRGTEYCPIELKLISRKTPKSVLKEVKDSAKLIFSTYAMFAKGVDVARLAAGLDATPRSQAEQMHGRILRELDGKRKPIWVTVLDSASYRSAHQLEGRIADYARNNAALFKLNDDWSTTPCLPNELKREMRDRVEDLKSARIEPVCAGLNTLLYPGSLNAHEREVVALTKRPALRRPTSLKGSSTQEPCGKSPTKTSRTRLISNRSPSRSSPGR